MSYVDALLEKEHDIIHVVERVNGQRVYKDYPINYTFYYDDPRGKFRSVYGNTVSRFSTRSSKDFQKEKAIFGNKKLYESDINPVFRCFSENYAGVASPKLHTCFFDIETNFDKNKGFAPVEDPFNNITAISLYLDWLDQLITLVMPPEHMTVETATDICNEFENTILFTDEKEMLKTFLDLIDDADILTGWNSEGYDIPYTVNRVTKVLSKDDTRKFCLWGQYPKKRMFERFGKESLTFDLIGRVHMDYMQLYRKYTYHEMHSYSLDAISEYELDEKKVAYEGSLDQLYNQDFKKFIDYNRQDVALIAKMDKKLKFMDLANELAHANTVLLQTTMGAVAVTEMAIINEAHERGLIVPDRKKRNDNDIADTQAAGAYVAYPRKGLHDYIGAIDINSLYPSTIRALNMGPETIVGQLNQDRTDAYLAERMKTTNCSYAQAWEGLFATLEYSSVMNQEKGTEITIEWEAGESTVHSADEVWDLIFAQGRQWTLSANGTIFTHEVDGIIPGLLKRWYAERKELQAKKKEATDPEMIAHWDKLQNVKKINLNSLYGALLNPGCRFNDKRIGQSTTLTGRSIAKHMHSKINEILAGEYNHVGEAIIYGDTDSSYFSAWPIIKTDVEAGKMEWNKDMAVSLYDNIAEQVNDSFPAFMEQAFHCPREAGSLIRGGRELVARTGLFITKKIYGVLIYDMEGTRLDLMEEAVAKKKGVIPGVGKVKAMGMALKRSDTPKDVQDFLTDVLTDTLMSIPKETIIKNIRDFKMEFTKKASWEKGTPKRVNNLTNYTAKEKAQGKANLPGHVRAAMNWNNLRAMNSDKYSMAIVDGQKTIMCKLKQNPMGYTSVAYPIDETRLPKWFTDLPFDDNAMEDTIIDNKVENLLGVLDWDIAQACHTKNTFMDLFA